jgi:glycosyltransferase involved in cell wall biosynthesis/SAM-dependent methyltransferase
MSDPVARRGAQGQAPAGAERDADAAPPLVSVVIPCYNHARFLPDAIASVRAQSHRPVEIVVVDDGSEDDTPRVAAAHPDVRYVRQENRGLAAARNAGMHASRGEYLVFLDADDRLLPHALEVGLACLAAHPDAAFASGAYRFIREDGSPAREMPLPPVDPDAYAAFLRGNHVGMHAAVIFRREALEEIGGYDPTLRACEDYDVYLRVARHHAVCRHPGVVAEYRQHGSNMSGDTRLMLDSVLAVLRRQEEHVRGRPRLEEALRAGVRAWKEHYAREAALQLSRGGSPFHHGRRTMRGIAAIVRYGPGWVARGLTSGEFAVRPRMAALLARIPFRRPLRNAARWLTPGTPPVGRVDLGDARRVTPISRCFGYDRGVPIDRYYIERFLERNAGAIRGRVLEIGDNAYTVRFGGDRVERSDVLHVTEGNPQATFVGDLTTASHIPSAAFDCVILTQTLHLIYDPRAALEAIRRILRPGGVLLATFPGISQIDRDEWRDTWYWSFTAASAARLFGGVFPETPLTLETHGNVLTAVGFLHGLALEELRPEELEHHDPHYPLIIAVRAVKPEAA